MERLGSVAGTQNIDRILRLPADQGEDQERPQAVLVEPARPSAALTESSFRSQDDRIQSALVTVAEAKRLALSGS